MKRPWLVVAALAAMTAGPAFAADMPLKAVPAVPYVDNSWTGWYVGAEIGGERTTSNWQPTCLDASSAATCTAAGLAAFPGFPDGNNSFHTNGMRYGLYYGWMFQAAEHWVFGVESDYAFHNKTSTFPGIVGCSSAACTGGAFGPGPFTGDSTSIKNGDDFSLRVRAGFLVLPNVQLYATGGVAAQRETATVTCSFTGAAGCAPVFPVTAIVETDTKTLVGWTVGAGIEWKVIDHILLRGEYRYNDYGTWHQSAFIGSNQLSEFADIHVKSQMATFGIAYLFPPPRW